MIEEGQAQADASLAELIDDCIAGDPDAVAELRWRVCERVLARLRLAIGVFAVERAASQVLGRVLDEFRATNRAGAAERLARRRGGPVLRRVPCPPEAR